MATRNRSHYPSQKEPVEQDIERFKFVIFGGGKQLSGLLDREGFGYEMTFRLTRDDHIKADIVPEVMQANRIIQGMTQNSMKMTNAARRELLLSFFLIPFLDVHGRKLLQFDPPKGGKWQGKPR